MQFYEKYLRLCHEKGEKPSTAAEKMGFKSAHVYRWKTGSTPTDATLMVIAEYFGVNMAELLPDEELARRELIENYPPVETKKDPAEISEVDQELYDLLTEMKDRPDLRILMHNAKDASPELIKSISNMIANFKQG